jgi:large subunit ribosomal protein L24
MDFEGAGLSPKALVGSLNGGGTVSIEHARFAALDPGAFASAMRAADRGVGLEPTRIAPVVKDALNAGSLEIATLEGAVSMAAGQIRLSTVVARAEGVELAVSGRYDIGRGDLDARLVLAGEEAGNGTGRPEIAVALRGEAFSPQRTVDVSSLSGWLALRAVEQQAKKLEAIERARAAAPPPEIQTSAPAVTAAPAPAAPSPPAVLPPERNIATPRARAAAPAAEPETHADVPQRAAPLPPPLTITPAPGIFRRQPVPARPPSANPPAGGRTF